MGSGSKKNGHTQEQQQLKWIEYSNYSGNTAVLEQQHHDDDGLAIHYQLDWNVIFKSCNKRTRRADQENFITRKEHQ
eukprot:8175177-Ditylum_brightwellii.AAC.2